MCDRTGVGRVEQAHGFRRQCHMITRFERTHEKLWSRTASGRCPLVESFHITFWLGNLLFFIQKNIGFSFKMMDITQTVNDDAKVNVIS